jgi:hypothetical protein
MEECKHYPRTYDGCNRQNQQRTIFEINMHEGVAPFANDHTVAGAIARTANFEDGASALGVAARIGLRPQ